MWRKILVAFGSMAGLYAALELGRIIFWHWRKIAWHDGFALEFALIAIALVWIIISAIDDLFMKSDFLGGHWES